MKRGVFRIALTFIMVTSLVLASCGKTTTTPASTTTSTSTTTTSTSTNTTVPTSTSTPTVTTVTTTTTGHWWDSLGTPTYGGTLVQRNPADITSFDPYLGVGPAAGFQPYMQTMFCNKYTTDPAIWDFSQGFLPPE